MPTLRRAALTAAILLLAGCGSPTHLASPGAASSGVAGELTASASPSSVSPPTTDGQVWSVPDAVRGSADAGLADALGSVTSPADGPRYAVTAIREQGDWALVMIEDADPQMAADAGFAVAVRASGQWTVVQATDNATFCAALAKAPVGALTSGERDYFMGCH